MSHDSGTVKLAKWPFYLADVLLSGVVFFVLYQLGTFEGTTDTIIVAVCLVVAGLAAWISILPWLKEHDSTVHLTDSTNLKSSVEQIKSVEKVADLIRQSNAQWQSVQDASARTVATAQEITERMKLEADEFMKFLGRAHEQERAGLKLEVEKFRRMEGDWIKVTVQIMDHIYALFRAAERSGQQNLIAQLGQFQNACRDLARRMGLVPFLPVIGEAFDTRAHQLADPKLEATEGAPIQDVLACGFTYQGQLLRRALVLLAGNAFPTPVGMEEAAAEPPGEIVGEASPEPAPAEAANETELAAPEESPFPTQERTEEIESAAMTEVFEEVQTSEEILPEPPALPESPEEMPDATAPRRGSKKKSPQDELPF